MGSQMTYNEPLRPGARSSRGRLRLRAAGGVVLAQDRWRMGVGGLGARHASDGTSAACGCLSGIPTRHARSQPWGPSVSSLEGRAGCLAAASARTLRPPCSLPMQSIAGWAVPQLEEARSRGWMALVSARRSRRWASLRLFLRAVEHLLICACPASRSACPPGAAVSG